MAYDNLFQPGIYKAWNEAIIKEKKIRMKWHADYESKVKQKAAWDEREHDLPVQSCTCRGRISPIADDEEVKMEWPRRGATGTNTILRVFDAPSSMIFPSPMIRGILYEGISQDGKGRAGYLKRRWKKDPEERFRDQICTSWMYGWNYGKENELSCQDPDNCNIRKIAFGFK